MCVSEREQQRLCDEHRAIEHDRNVRHAEGLMDFSVAVMVAKVIVMLLYDQRDAYLFEYFVSSSSTDSILSA